MTLDSRSAPAPTLAEGLELYVELMRAGGPPRSLSSQRLRSDLSASDLRVSQPRGMETVTTFIVREGQEIAVKLYIPESGAPVPRPAICYFHGGGFVFGSIESFDAIPSALAAQTGAVVASVEYRRLPENSYRSAQEDCYASLVWLHEHAEDLGIDTSRIAVAGDSVGALLATIAAAMARDGGGPRLVCQILLYGAFALQSGRACYSNSVDPLLTPQRIDSFISAYHRQQDPNFYPAPLSLRDVSGLPPAIILAAEHDPLRDEALEYANFLRAGAVPVDFSVASGMIHGFLRAMKMCPAASRQMAELAEKTRTHLTVGVTR